MIRVELTERETCSVIRTLEFARDCFDAMGLRGDLGDLGTEPGQSPLEIAHSKLIAALEREEAVA